MYRIHFALYLTDQLWPTLPVLLLPIANFQTPFSFSDWWFFTVRSAWVKSPLFSISCSCKTFVTMLGNVEVFLLKRTPCSATVHFLNSMGHHSICCVLMVKFAFHFSLFFSQWYAPRLIKLQVWRMTRHYFIKFQWKNKKIKKYQRSFGKNFDQFTALNFCK